MKIWFRVGMEADVTKEEMDVLLAYSGQIDGERDCTKAHYIMEKIIERAELRGETYILCKNNGCAADEYDNPDEEIDFLY